MYRTIVAAAVVFAFAALALHNSPIVGRFEEPLLLLLMGSLFLAAGRLFGEHETAPSHRLPVAERHV